MTDHELQIGGLKIAGEDDSWDFGTGAGFYVDATQEPWSKGYKMYSYITSELPKALFGEYRQLDSQRISISGHSMGGHGALMVVSGEGALASSPGQRVFQFLGVYRVLFCIFSCGD